MHESISKNLTHLQKSLNGTISKIITKNQDDTYEIDKRSSTGKFVKSRALRHRQQTNKYRLKKLQFLPILSDFAICQRIHPCLTIYPPN